MHMTASYSPADEIVQIVDKDNNPIDTVPRSVMRSQCLIHRACYILVFHPDGKLFVQKRTTTKDVFPGYLDIAAGGVILAGEEADSSAQRELAEELGIHDVPLEFLFEHYYEDGSNKVWGYVYRCTHAGPFILQEEEIESGRFMSISEIFNKDDATPFTPDGLEILARLFPQPTGIES